MGQPAPRSDVARTTLTAMRSWRHGEWTMMRRRKDRSPLDMVLSVSAVPQDQLRAVIAYGCLMTVYAKARQRLEVAGSTDGTDAGDLRLMPLLEAATADAGLSGLLPNDELIAQLETAALGLHADISDDRQRHLAACQSVIDRLAAAARDDGLAAIMRASASAVVRAGDRA
jgi:hypothetical protein